MTGANLIISLARRVEDENYFNYSSTDLLNALNLAQLRLLNLAERNWLKPFESVKTGAVPTSGVYALSGITDTILRGRILDVYDDKNDRWAIQVEPNDRKRLHGVNWNNTSGSLTKTYFYIYGNSLYLLPDSVDDIDIYYLKKPDDIANDATVLSWDGQLEEAFLDFAESEIWKTDNQPNRFKLAFENGIGYLQALNVSVPNAHYSASVMDVMSGGDTGTTSGRMI